MIAAFPDPYPGESLYGVCSRYAERMGYRHKSDVMRDLFGTPTAKVSLAFPNRLGYLAAALPPGSRYSVDRLVDDLTLVPLFEPFLPPERANKLRTQMASDDGRGISLVFGMAAARIPLPQYLRLCQGCVADDKRSVGEPYFHMIHHAPGVAICPLHGTELATSSARLGQGHYEQEFVSVARAMVLPLSVPDDQPSLLAPLLQLARDADWVLGRHLGSCLVDIHRKYTSALIARGLATHTGRARMSQLVEEFRRYFPPGFLQCLHCELEDGRYNWLTDLVQATRKGKHPVQHLLLMQFLGYSAERFFAMEDEHRPFGLGPWPCLNSACKDFQRPVITECSVSQYRQRKGQPPMGTFACACGFVYSRIGPDTSPRDAARVGKVHARGPQWEHLLLTLWNDPTLSLAQAARRLGVTHRMLLYWAENLGLPKERPNGYVRPSDITHGRRVSMRGRHGSDVESARASYRASWLAAQAENPAAGVTELRATREAEHSWLRHHDRPWLVEYQPAPKPTRRRSLDWEERDRDLAVAVKVAASELFGKPGRPVRVTLTLIGRHTGQLEMLATERHRLPRTCAALAEVVETRVDFAVRRVQWATERFREERAVPTRNQLVRRASVGGDLRRHPQVSRALDRGLADRQASQGSAPE